jgi:hypothetical protein
MTQDELLKLAKFISRYSHHNYQYGKYDCMLFPAEWNDVRSGTKKADAIRDNYYDKFTAMKFYKNFISVEGWLKGAGYHEIEVDVDNPIIDGDMVVSGMPEWPLVYVAFQGNLYYMSEDSLFAYNTKVVNKRSVWRK